MTKLLEQFLNSHGIMIDIFGGLCLSIMALAAIMFIIMLILMVKSFWE